MGLLGACAGGTSRATPQPSFLHNCETWSGAEEPALTCDEAISAALGTLPPHHPPVVLLEFHYGSPCGPSGACAARVSDRGYVVVEMAAPDSDQWISVLREANGTVVTGPAVGSTPIPAASMRP